MPTGRAPVLILLAIVVGLAPAAGWAQTADQPEASPPVVGAPEKPSEPPSENDQIYDGNVRAAFAAAQNRKGPLEGAWRVLDAQGRTALKLELSDGLDGSLGGAWFDPNAADRARSTGLIDDALRQGAGFTIHLLPQGSLELTTLQVQPGADGAWTGTLVRGGRSERVAMNRDPASAAAGVAASGSASPYNPVVAKAPAKKPAAKKKVVKKAPAKKPAVKKPARK